MSNLDNYVSRKAAEKNAMIQPKRRNINTPFLGTSSPSEFLGVKLKNFSFSQLFFIGDKNNENEENNENILKQEIVIADKNNSIEKENPLELKMITVREEIYQNIVVNQNSFISFKDKKEGIKTTYSFYKYEDFSLKTQFKADRERLVIRIERTTPRGTILSTICRIYTTGTNLYIAIDSYLLGKTNVLSLIIHTLLLLPFASIFLGSIAGSLAGLVILLTNLFSFDVKVLLLTGILPLLSPAIPSLYLYFSWFPVIKALFNKEGFKAALKHRFHNKNFSNLFDEDDGLTYLKSVTPYIFEQIESTLFSHGIKEPERFAEITKAILSQPAVSIINSGSMFGFQIGNNNVQ